MLVGGVIVGDGMDQFAGRHGGLDGVEEADELLVAMLLHAAADDAAIQHIESGKQCGGAMPDVVMRHGPAAALLHRQARLGAIERLDLALFVDRQTRRHAPADRHKGRRCRAAWRRTAGHSTA